VRWPGRTISIRFTGRYQKRLHNYRHLRKVPLASFHESYISSSTTDPDATAPAHIPSNIRLITRSPPWYGALLPQPPRVQATWANARKTQSAPPSPSIHPNHITAVHRPRTLQAEPAAAAYDRRRQQRHRAASISPRQKSQACLDTCRHAAPGRTG